MRVTNQMMTASVQSQLLDQVDRLMTTQTSIATGKRINAPSDDPIGMGMVMGLRSTIADVEQYERNIRQADSLLQLTESTLGSMDTLLIRAKEVAVYQATGTATADTRRIAAEEVRQIRDQLLDLANTKSGNRYIFAGYRTDAPAFAQEADGIVYRGDDGRVRVALSDDADIATNVTGDAVLTGDVDLFEVLDDLIDGLEADAGDRIAAQTEGLEAALNQVVDGRTAVGARLNRLETAANHWMDVKTNLQAVLSETEEIDLAEAYTALSAQEAAYEATLNSAARIIQPSLLQFLG